MSETKNHREEEDAELERARVLLERTVQFLSHCMEDPQAALKAEDPRDLIQGLRSLSVQPMVEEPPEAADEQRTIQIRRRRSA
jgi:hypothetical protein